MAIKAAIPIRNPIVINTKLIILIVSYLSRLTSKIHAGFNIIKRNKINTYINVDNNTEAVSFFDFPLIDNPVDK